MQIASNHHITYESVDKKFLVNLILIKIQDISRIENEFIYKRDAGFDFFLELLGKENIRDNYFIPGNTGYLQDNHIILFPNIDTCFQVNPLKTILFYYHKTLDSSFLKFKPFKNLKK
jgi:hypothetical protein